MKYLQIKEQLLNEINMSPNSLRRAAASIGARAGMEFEMIVPDVGTADVEPEYEPDFDQDQRTRSFDDIRQFFHDGDYNGRRQVDNLIEEIEGEYREWQMEQTDEAWARDGLEFITDYISRNDLYNRDEAMLTARDEVMDANPDLPQESEDFTQLLSARLDEMERAFAAGELEDRGRIYNDAYEEFSDEQGDEYDERSFLDDKYPYMQDVSGNFDISWPYYIDINADSDGDGADIEQVADEFSSAVGREVEASSSYHSGSVTRPSATSLHYVVEPDGSLEGDNPGDSGLEFVSPALPIDELLSDLKKVKAWADKTGCYTNDSTGLHINVSVPAWQGDLSKLDYVKLAVLMGDEYVLEEFGRSGNTYAKSAMKIVKDHVKQRPEDAELLLSKMKEHLNTSAAKLIHSGTTNKFTSINTKDGYIEFRSPGGDWLNSNFDKIESTLLRFVVAMDAAVDETKYKEEYAKKLYKVLAPGSDEPGIVQLFANYSAGDLPKDALIRQVRQQQLARDVAKGKGPAGKMWWRVGLKSNPNYAIEVVGATRAEAIQAAKDADSNLRRFNYDAGNDFTAKPVRAYEETPTQIGNQRSTEPAAAQALSATNQGNWGIWMTSADRFARSPGQPDINVLRRFPSREAAEQFITQTRAERPDMRTDIEVREIEPSVQNTGSATSGNWGVWVPSLDRYATVGNAGPRRFENRAGAEAWIQDYNQRHAGNDLELQVREIEPTQPQFQEPAPGRGNLTPTGPGPWEIYRISDNSSVRELSNTSRPAAAEEARNALGLRGEAPELYGVRTRGSADAAQGGTVDVATDRAAPQTLTRPGQGQQTFTGNWLIKDASGSVLHRFGGIGNSQSDANRIAMQWLRSNPRLIAGGVEVVPEMQ